MYLILNDIARVTPMGFWILCGRDIATDRPFLRNCSHHISTSRKIAFVFYADNSLGVHLTIERYAKEIPSNIEYRSMNSSSTNLMAFHFCNKTNPEGMTCR